MADQSGSGGQARRRWQRRYDQARIRDADFTTLSGLEVDPVYGPPPGTGVPGFERIGWPGEYPFTRGVHREMYRKQLWTIRQYAGYASAKESNERYKYLLAHGSTGLSMAFDLPTQLGLDSDDPRSLGEVGRTRPDRLQEIGHDTIEPLDLALADADRLVERRGIRVFLEFQFF